MESIIIKGGHKLEGKISVHGSKNSCLPLLAAVILTEDVCVIHNCPDLTDVLAAVKILEYLGCRVERDGDVISVDSKCLTRCDIPESLMREMRSSIVFLGSVLSRLGQADMYTPGGCEIGLRPIDLHLSALKTLGAEIDESHGKLSCKRDGKLKGRNIDLPFPSVGATENIILACAVSDGVTNIYNAAREPEIAVLVDFLNKCGAKISISSDGTVSICGVERLHGCEFSVIPDRITAATYMAAVVSAGGDVLVENVIPLHLKSVISVFEQTGCKLNISKNSLRIKVPDVVLPIRNVRTMPYPGFPTDAQAPVMAMATKANGTSVIVENIFESRFKHVPQLLRLGAKIKIEDRVAVIDGVKNLYGAKVEATDLRGGGSLIVAALRAEGTTEITQTQHIDRGYEKIETALGNIGADIKRG